MNWGRLIPALLVGLAACSPATESGSPSSPAPSAEPLRVALADFMIEPSEVETMGPTVTIEVTNDGPTPHNLSVRNASDRVLMATEDLRAGEVTTIRGGLEPGEYTIFCSLAGHESLGMSGTLVVSTP